MASRHGVHIGKTAPLLCGIMAMFLAMGLVLAAAGAAMAQEAPAWWSDKWTYRRSVSVDASSVPGAEQLSNVPVLVRLHSGNFSFAQALPGGEDIRFVDVQNKVVLDHQVEFYDVLEEIAFVWVKVPKLSAGLRLWVYYGNPEAKPVAGKNFDVSTVAAYHFAETEGLPQDATTYSNNASEAAVGQGFSSIIGRGVSFNGVSDKVVVPGSPSMSFGGGLTFSAWVRLFQPQEDGVLLSMGEDDAFTLSLQGAKLAASLQTDPFTLYQVSSETELTMGEYHHVAVTLTPNQGLTLYIDGEAAGTRNFSEPVPELDGFVLGAARTEGRNYAGEMDEARLSTTARPQAWLKVQQASQGSGGVVAVAMEEVAESGNLSLYYFSIIMDNLTAEAWLIIGILLIISIASWLILLTKAFSLTLTDKENQVFREEFEELQPEELNELQEEADGYKNSVLCSLYLAGCKELDIVKTRTGMDSRKATGLVERALERQYMRESKKLNAYLVVMTIAISGGPFLGLLGTVWGVMNTFAALTLAGEASLMAIAPGIASSLTTTVFGLIVAIPALFGYNYLVTKIKNITTDMVGFMDQFLDRAEEAL